MANTGHGKSVKLTLTHQISKGKTAERHYGMFSKLMYYTSSLIYIIIYFHFYVGLQLAAISTMPKAIVSHAQNIAGEIHQQKIVS